MGEEQHEVAVKNRNNNRLISKRKLASISLLVVWAVITGVLALTKGRDSIFTILFVLSLVPILLYPLLRYMYVRLVKPFTTPLSKDQVRSNSHKKFCNTWSKSELVGLGLFTVLVLVAFSPPLLVDSLASTETKPYMVFAYNFLGSLIFVLLWTGFIDLADLFVGTALRRKSGVVASAEPYWKSIELTSNKKQQQLKAGAILVCYTLTTFLSLYFAYQDPDLTEQQVVVKNLPACMEGYSLLLISDVHAGPLVGKETVGRLVDQVLELQNAGRVDAVVLVGDFADGLPENVGGALVDFERVVNATPDGVYFVTGNHEFLHNQNKPSGELWVNFFESIGVISLNNTRVELKPSGDPACPGIDLLGVDDFSLGKPDLQKAAQGRDPSRASVLLAHQPKQSKEAIELGIDVQLSGHVHAGHTWPLHFITYIDQPFFAGLESEGAFQIYTSQGAFGWGPRTRLGSSNNIDLVTLKSGAEIESAPMVAPTKWAIASYPLFVLTVLACVCWGPLPLSKRLKRVEPPSPQIQLGDSPVPV